MRSSILLALLGIGLLAVPLAAQDICEATPRWLIVTVVGTEIINTEMQREGEPVTALNGIMVLDRCSGGDWPVTFSEYISNLPGGRAQAQIWVRRDDDAFGEDAGWWVYYVRESVHDICSVLEDCGDASSLLNVSGR